MSQRLVVILGAGASAPWGHPVMSQFMQVARRRRIHWETLKKNSQAHKLEEMVNLCNWFLRAYSTLIEFQTICRQSSWAMNRSWDNIEELYTQADLLRIAGLEDAEALFPTKQTPPLRSIDELCLLISLCIWDIYRLHNPRNTNVGAYPYVNRIIKQGTAAGLSTTIVTTNYDVLVERNLLANQIPFSYPGIKFQYMDRGFPLWNDSNSASATENPVIADADTPNSSASTEEGIKLVKLHGSVNWFERISGSRRECLVSILFDKPLTTQSRQNVNDFTRCGLSTDDFSPTSFNNWCEAAGIPLWDDKSISSISESKDRQLLLFRPLIIPPLLGKTASHNIFQSQMKEAIEAIADAVAVVVVGYSFPATDIFMSRLISQGLSSNTSLDHFWILDKSSPETWEDRLNRLFNPTFRSSKLHYLDCDSSMCFAKTKNDFVTGILNGNEQQVLN